MCAKALTPSQWDGLPADDDHVIMDIDQLIASTLARLDQMA